MKTIVSLKDFMHRKKAAAKMKVSYASYLEEACPNKKEEIKTIFREVSQDNSEPLLQLIALVALGEKEQVEHQVNEIIESKELDYSSVRTVALYFSKFAPERYTEYLNSVVTALDSAIKNSPENGEYYAVRGFCYTGTHDIYEAEKDFRRALQLDPTNELYQLVLCFHLEKAGRTEESKKIIPSIVYSERICDYLRLMMLRSRNYIAISQFDSGLAMIDELLAIDPSNTEVRSNKVAVLAIDLARHEDALVECNIMLDDNPNYSDGYLQMVYILGKQGNLKVAKEKFFKALELGYSRVNMITSSLHYIGVVMMQKNEFDPALWKLYEKWGANSKEALEDIARVYFFFHQYHDLNRILEVALKQCPKHMCFQVLKAAYDIRANIDGYKLRVDALLEMPSMKPEAIDPIIKGLFAIVLRDLAKDQDQLDSIKYLKLSLAYKNDDEICLEIAERLNLKGQYKEAFDAITQMSPINIRFQRVMRLIASLSLRVELQGKIAEFLASQNTVVLFEDDMVLPMFISLCDAIARSTQLYRLVIHFMLPKEKESQLNAALLTNKSIRELDTLSNIGILPALKQSKTIENVHFVHLTQEQRDVLVVNKLCHLEEGSDENRKIVNLQRKQLRAIVDCKSKVIPVEAFTILQFNMYKKTDAYHVVFRPIARDLASQQEFEAICNLKIAYNNACVARLNAWKSQHLPVLIKDFFATAIAIMPEEILEKVATQFSIDDIARLIIKARLFASENSVLAV